VISRFLGRVNETVVFGNVTQRKFLVSDVSGPIGSPETSVSN
jgi:hypothetical protein